VEVTLSRVVPLLEAAVLDLRPLPGQERFAPGAAETLPVARAEPARHPVAILERGRPVGFFVLDEAYPALALAASPRPVGLRGFFVDGAHQGRGVATAALRGLAAHVRERLPGATSVLVQVAPDNPGARNVYVAAGFVSTGATWDHGPSGPQEALELTL
jgi:RimJ/RimL family protein N-acetyltransferase